eukprot:CAMPEP_0177677718 /NCGR_PEP_ID=MMETSP0447-20121125/28577_1 /TAXON_ID=0 /ORGANISM="Stygamoeba regulata, Strain BSH-02190019" /LENGTH=118 /DNA_ID=CAMNT_0019186577 /DNA_START=501 /DNA_END=857 /DNA_ORIENTATION=-
MTNFKRQQHDKLFQETAASRFKRQQHDKFQETAHTRSNTHHLEDTHSPEEHTDWVLSGDAFRRGETKRRTRVNTYHVDLADVDLSSGVILGGNETASGGALARHVRVDDLSFDVLHDG